MKMEFEGRTAIVTGGAAGIGKAVSQNLVAKGAFVFIGDIDSAKAEKAVVEIAPSKENCVALPLDLADNLFPVSIRRPAKWIFWSTAPVSPPRRNFLNSPPGSGTGSWTST